MLEPAFQVVHPLPSHFSGGPSICLLSVQTPNHSNQRGFSLVGGISKFPLPGKSVKSVQTGGWEFVSLTPRMGVLSARAHKSTSQ